MRRLFSALLLLSSSLFLVSPLLAYENPNAYPPEDGYPQRYYLERDPNSIHVDRPPYYYYPPPPPGYYRDYPDRYYDPYYPRFDGDTVRMRSPR